MCIYIYTHCRLQKRGPILGIIGAETGRNSKLKWTTKITKNHFPPRVGLQLYVSRGAILTFARAPFVGSIMGPSCCTT